MPNTMHSFDSSSSNVPAFLVKLWKLVEDPSCDDLIAWSDSGYSFVIKDQAKFAKELLPQYFKHNNMASFIRQLNMYGFKKVMNIEKSGLRNENDEMEFQNAFFMKEKAELLELIKRKIPNTRVVAEPPAPKANAKEILIDLSTIREKQESMDNMLLKMKKENELLWRELTSMRQKHKAQEQIIQKVIQFLVSIVQRSNPNIGVQRKITRMIHNSPASKASSSQVSRTIDVLRKNNADCIIVPEAISPLGPVIHEVTDGDHEEPQDSTSTQFIDSSTDQVESSNSKENKLPKVATPTSPGTPIESLSILEGLSPRTTNLDASSSSDDNESILGIPLDYITINNDNMNVISIPENGTISNVISIPEDSNVISIPENSNINSIISIAGVDSTIGNVISVPYNGDVISNSSSILDKAAEDLSSDPCENISNPDDISDCDNMSHMDYFNDIAALTELPSTSFSLPKDDFHEQLMSSMSLNTPKILLSDEENLSSPTKSFKEKSRKTKKSGQLSPKKSVTHDEHNYQLTTKDTTVAKNVLSNHLLSVDEKLNFTQDRLASTPWNMDVQSLLGVCGLQNCWTLDPQLFSSDEVLNCDSFTNPLPDDINIKSEPSDIVGNELVQYFPNMMDIGNTQLFEALNSDAEVPSGDQGVDFSYQPGSLLQEVLNETAASEAVDDTAASQAAAEFLKNELLLDCNLAKRKKTSKTVRGKRRKMK